MITNNNFGDQKHCSCKRSRCLKLYCDCFSAGLYCGETCSCQECFNSLDYEDTVDETRRQIELRNPQAFSPKIHNEDRDHHPMMPIIGGKHKKGCNCKKSMCMKRYCECYQANVGCSGECRCEGCKNVFGKKGEYNVCNQSTPWAPLLQHSGEEKSAAGLPNGCYNPSPGYANCDDHMISSGTSNENFDMASSDQQSYSNYVESVNQFTPPDTARHPVFMSNLPPPTTDWPDISRANENNLSPVISWPGSLVTPVSLFGGSKINDPNEKPLDNIDKSTPNARISTNSQVQYHNTGGSMTSDQ